MKSRRSTVLLAGATGLALAATVEAAAFPRAVARNVVPPTTAMSKTARHGWMPPNAKSMKLLYVSDYTESQILAYQQGRESSGPIGEIVDGISTPQGIAVDSSGTLYVANQGNDTITEYPAGASEPTVTLSSGNDEPLDVANPRIARVLVTAPRGTVTLKLETVVWAADTPMIVRSAWRST